MGNGRNTVSRVLFRRRELTEFCGKLGEFCEKLGELCVRTQIISRKELTEFAPRNSVSPEKTHWVWCLKPYSPKPYSARLRPYFRGPKRNKVWSEGREWGVGSVVVGSAFGAPWIFAPRRSETLQNKGFQASGLQIGTPKNADPTTTDPPPHPPVLRAVQTQTSCLRCRTCSRFKAFGGHKVLITFYGCLLCAILNTCDTLCQF